MLDKQGSDLWAGSYDESVHHNEKAGQDLFAGCRDVLNTVRRTVCSRGGVQFLDSGFGIGALTFHK